MVPATGGGRRTGAGVPRQLAHSTPPAFLPTAEVSPEHVAFFWHKINAASHSGLGGLGTLVTGSSVVVMPPAFCCSSLPATAASMQVPTSQRINCMRQGRAMLKVLQLPNVPQQGKGWLAVCCLCCRYVAVEGGGLPCNLAQPVLNKRGYRAALDT